MTYHDIIWYDRIPFTIVIAITITVITTIITIITIIINHTIIIIIIIIIIIGVHGEVAALPPEGGAEHN